MENNQQPTSENRNQQGVVSSSEEGVPSPAAAAQTRLYECSFCKKGFSNAQALGGHMNIHRKDKAKLKQASKENQKLMDGQAKMIPLTPSSTTGNTTHSKPLEFTTGQLIKTISTTTTTTITNILTNKWLPSTFAPNDHQQLSYESHVALSELKQLPLFVETASRVAVAASPSPVTVDNNINYSNHPINQHHHRPHAQANWQEDRSQLHLSTQGSFGAELDLELRLGHEPQKPTVALGTRKFF